MKLKEYSSLSGIEKDITQLTIKLNKLIREYKNVKIALAFASGEVKSNIKFKELVDNKIFWSTFNYVRSLSEYLTVANNIEISLKHEFKNISPENVKIISDKLNKLISNINNEKVAIGSYTSILANNMIPKSFKDIVIYNKKIIQKALNRKCKVKYQLCSRNNNVGFIGYLYFKDLIDKNHFNNPNFYIGIIKELSNNSSKISYYCGNSIVDKFKPTYCDKENLNKTLLEELNRMRLL